MVTENSDAMVEAISLKGRKIYLLSSVLKNKRKVYMKQSKNCYQDQLQEEFTKLIKNSLFDEYYQNECMKQILNMIDFWG